MAFDGANHFARVTAVCLAAAIIAWPYSGVWGLLGVGIALYFLLSFYNSLERRDLRDEQQRRKLSK